MKTILFILLCLFLFSCEGKKPQEKFNTTNPNYQVELLFEVDSCKVYRFCDGRYYYFVNCKGAVMWEENNNGKNKQDFNIPTDK